MEKAENRPKIGLISSIAFAVGTMVGAGVFILSGPAIEKAGPAALLAYALAGISVLFSALSFSVVTSLAPAGASGFAYVRTVLGPFYGFITAWAFYIGGVIGCAFILDGFGVYLQKFYLHNTNPLLLSMFAAVLLTALNLGPASLVGKAEVVLVGIKVLTLLVFIAFGIPHWSSETLHPFVSQGFQPVFHESGQLFVAFLGFSVICSMAGDIKNASKTIPTAILCSMLIVALIYGGVVMSLLAASLPSYSESSVGTAAATLIGRFGPAIIAAAALVSILSCANANILGCSEIMVRLASKGEVPTLFGKMYNGHPLISVLTGAIIYTGLMLTGNSETIVSYTNVATIVMLSIINIAAFFALKKKLIYKKLYPFSMIIPAIGLACGLVQLFQMDFKSVMIGAAFVLAGSLLYSLRHKFHITYEHKRLKEHMKQLNGPLSKALKKQPESFERLAEKK